MGKRLTGRESRLRLVSVSPLLMFSAWLEAAAKWSGFRENREAVQDRERGECRE